MKAAITISTLLFAGTASAQTLTFNSRQAWLNAGAHALTTETFESEFLGAIAVPDMLDSGLTVDLFNGNVSTLINAGMSNVGHVNTTPMGRNWLQYGDSGETGSYTARFRFDGAEVNAFGFDVSGLQTIVSSGAPGQGGVNIGLYRNGQIIDDFFWQIDTQINDINFLGVLNSTPFDEVRISINPLGSIVFFQEADWVAFDDVSWGLPTPGTASILALGGIVSCRRRR